MNQPEIIIRKTPFLFLRWLVIIEFLFAILPFLVATLLRAQDAYDTSPLAGTVSYSLLVAIVMTALQVLIITTSFVAWYLPVYQVDKQRILYSRSNLFEDKELIATQSIKGIEIKQGVLARRLEYGTLVISNSETTDRAHVRDIANPARYAKLIESLIETRHASQPSPEPRPARELIVGGEDQYVEFKSSLMWDYRRQMVNKGLYEPVMKNIVAFMNSTGGTVIIGVDDDGNVLGLEPDYQVIRKPNADGFENVFNMAFNKMIGVEYRRFVDVSFPEVDGRQICVVSVRPASRAAYLVYKGTETFYVRAGNASQPLSVSQATRYVQDHFSIQGS